jgi:SH3 domain-containing YSC84-like protein 1
MSVTDLNADDDNNQAYYNQQASPAEILSGQVSNPQAETLKHALPA